MGNPGRLLGGSVISAATPVRERAGQAKMGGYLVTDDVRGTQLKGSPRGQSHWCPQGGALPQPLCVPEQGREVNLSPQQPLRVSACRDPDPGPCSPARWRRWGQRGCDSPGGPANGWPPGADGQHQPHGTCSPEAGPALRQPGEGEGGRGQAPPHPILSMPVLFLGQIQQLPLTHSPLPWKESRAWWGGEAERHSSCHCNPQLSSPNSLFRQLPPNPPFLPAG